MDNGCNMKLLYSYRYIKHGNGKAVFVGWISHVAAFGHRRVVKNPGAPRELKGFQRK